MGDGMGGVVHGSDVLRRWLGWVTAGELAGFAVPAVVGPVAVGRGLPDGAVLGLAVLAGVAEGAVLGAAQAHVLTGLWPRLSVRRWVARTAAAAAGAWFLGMLPSTTASVWTTWPVGAQVAAGVPLAALLLVSIGLAQWTELRHHVPRAGLWVGGSAAAWCVGLAAMMVVVTPLWQPGQSLAVVVGVGVLGGLVMAFAMALTTGLVLRRLVRRAGALAQTPPANPSWRHAS